MSLFFGPPTKEDIWGEIEEKVEQLIDEKIATYAYNDVKAALDGLHLAMKEYLNAVDASQDNPSVISENWTAANQNFVQSLPKFQLEDYQLLLLPLFAQFANLHLTLLRDGVLFGSQWGWAQRYVDSIQKELSTAIQKYQDYTDNVYNANLMEVRVRAEFRAALQEPCEPFRTVNQFVRGMTESVLDYRNIWQYFDPKRYPDPVTISFDRELYSDPCGTCTDSGSIDLLSSKPPTASMEQITVWGWDRIDAIQIDYPSGQGPDGWTSTGRMGNSSGGSSTPPAGGVFDVRVSRLTGVWVGYGDIVNALWFSFGGGGWTSMMGGRAGKGSQHYDFEVSGDNYISRIHINGVSNYYGSADCIVIGYKYAPSDQSMQQAVRRLSVHTAGERSFQELAAQYASQIGMTSEEFLAQAAKEGWEQERQQYWQTLREQVQQRKAEGSGSGQGPSTSTETR